MDVVAIFDEMFHEVIENLSKSKFVCNDRKNYRTHMITKKGLRCRVSVSEIQLRVQLYTLDYTMIINVGYNKEQNTYIGITESTCIFKQYVDTVFALDKLGEI